MCKASVTFFVGSLGARLPLVTERLRCSFAHSMVWSAIRRRHRLFSLQAWDFAAQGSPPNKPTNECARARFAKPTFQDDDATPKKRKLSRKITDDAVVSRSYVTIGGDEKSLMPGSKARHTVYPVGVYGGRIQPSLGQRKGSATHITARNATQLCGVPVSSLRSVSFSHPLGERFVKRHFHWSCARGAFS
jgi:hypothetical protein